MTVNVFAFSRGSVTGRGGFTLLEALISVVIFSIIMMGVYSVFNVSEGLQAKSLDRSEAQQNARVALDMVERELRLAGYGISGSTQVPILVASEYRVTFVRDMNSNGLVDLGETITYFIEPNTSNPVSSLTANPRDTVLRRLVSDAGNPNADPVSGEGEVLAATLTQQTDDDGDLDIPMFCYYDADGNSLIDLDNEDPYGAFFGRSVPDAALGKPAGGTNDVQLATIHITVLCETEAVDQTLRDYGRVALGTTVTPRNLPVQMYQATPIP
jgi:prepilin-type N-terminal cleavage/methylation domain-containing protein